MRVLVCGDRYWTDYLTIQKQIVKLGRGTTIIQGEAQGADRLAKQAADHLGWPCESYPAKWDMYGRAAGPIRNKQMLDEGKPDLVLAFHDHIEESRGTKDMIKQAAKRGIETLLINHKRKDSCGACEFCGCHGGHHEACPSYIERR